MEAVLTKSIKEKKLEPLTKNLFKLRTKEQKAIKELLSIRDEIKDIINKMDSIK